MTDPRLRATAFTRLDMPSWLFLLGESYFRFRSFLEDEARRMPASKGTLQADKDALEDDILILYAGMAAEAMLTGEYHLPGARKT